MIILKSLAIKIKNKAPQTPGVYIFKNEKKEVLYIGKAINLKNRLLYYTKDEPDLFPKTAQFLKLAKSLNWIEVKSDLEALLLEINLIRTLKPKYNIVSKDDKRPLYIWITNDYFPKIKTARLEIAGTGDYIGPFTSAYKVKSILKKLRHIFPFCSCSNNKRKPCLFGDLRLCPMQFDSKGNNITNRSEYLKNIRRIKLFLNGKISQVLKLLNKEMLEYSQNQEYEKAEVIKNQIDSINFLLTAPNQISQYLTDSSIDANLKKSQFLALKQFINNERLNRIEAYDIANTSGTNNTASMVVFEQGFPNTSGYRKFKIKIEKADDPFMIYHTLARRFRHLEWPLPELILIDGGKTQVKAAQKAMSQFNLNIKLVGITKKFERLIIPDENNFKIVSAPTDSPYLTLLRAIRDEAHRFTTTYHKKLRQKSMLFT